MYSVTLLCIQQAAEHNVSASSVQADPLLQGRSGVAHSYTSARKRRKVDLARQSTSNTTRTALVGVPPKAGRKPGQKKGRDVQKRLAGTVAVCASAKSQLLKMDNQTTASPSDPVGSCPGIPYNKGLKRFSDLGSDALRVLGSKELRV
eukprot:2194553-Amphidinium_carterae.1